MKHLMFVLALASLSACGGDDGGSKVTVSVVFPSAATESNTYTLHAYVLKPLAENDCSELVGDATDPLDSSFELRGDAVAFHEDSVDITVEDVRQGPGIVYVEASNVVGGTILAGCTAAKVAGATSVEITLITPGTFDCSDPNTPDGSPCDDGTFCTTGKTCQGGSCKGGGPRDCGYLADDCNGTECTEELGCQPVPAPDDRSCEDGIFCTAGDTCQDGECVAGTGSPDCSAFDGECSVGVCDPDTDACAAMLSDPDTDCDADGSSCTIDTCTVGGTCQLAAEQCPTTVVHDCYAIAGCTDTGGTPACTITAVTPGTACNDQCMTGGTCDGTQCTGGTPNPTPGTEGPAGDASCRNGLDDDCDGSIDLNDTDCGA